jgi:hypothetical protein
MKGGAEVRLFALGTRLTLGGRIMTFENGISLQRATRS